MLSVDQMAAKIEGYLDCSKPDSGDPISSLSVHPSIADHRPDSVNLQLLRFHLSAAEKGGSRRVWGAGRVSPLYHSSASLSRMSDGGIPMMPDSPTTLITDHILSTRYVATAEVNARLAPCCTVPYAFAAFALPRSG